MGFDNRVSLEVPRNEQEEENERLETECEDGDNRSASFCRTLALIVSTFLFF